MVDYWWFGHFTTTNKVNWHAVYTLCKECIQWDNGSTWQCTLCRSQVDRCRELLLCKVWCSREEQQQQRLRHFEQSERTGSAATTADSRESLQASRKECSLANWASGAWILQAGGFNRHTQSNKRAVAREKWRASGIKGQLSEWAYEPTTRKWSDRHR